jgi:hypothetical protein
MRRLRAGAHRLRGWRGHEAVRARRRGTLVLLLELLLDVHEKLRLEVTTEGARGLVVVVRTVLVVRADETLTTGLKILTTGKRVGIILIRALRLVSSTEQLAGSSKIGQGRQGVLVSGGDRLGDLLNDRAGNRSSGLDRLLLDG